MLRYATEADRKQLEQIWRSCFDDPESFIKYFFGKRYTPDYTAVYEENGKILSCIHSLPLKINLRGTPVNGTVMSGVATVKEARGRGLMRSVLSFYMNGMREKGVCIVSHRPQTAGLYDFAGHYFVSLSRYIFAEGGRKALDPADKVDCCLTPIPGNIDGLYRCYTEYSVGYSGMILRTADDFKLKMSDYLSCGAKCLSIKNDADEIRAYCIFFDNDEILADECVAADTGLFIPLLNALFDYDTSNKTTARCAADTPVPESVCFRDEPKGVAGVCSIRSLLKAAGSTSLCAVRVNDPIVLQNNGVFTLTGECTDLQPVLDISAGELLQWALGYKKIDDIIRDGHAIALNGFNKRDFDLSPDMTCFTVDEY